MLLLLGEEVTKVHWQLQKGNISVPNRNRKGSPKVNDILINETTIWKMKNSMPQTSLLAENSFHTKQTDKLKTFNCSCSVCCNHTVKPQLNYKAEFPYTCNSTTKEAIIFPLSCICDEEEDIQLAEEILNESISKTFKKVYKEEW